MERNKQKVKQFAQEKAIYMVQFITSDRMVGWGSVFQKVACSYCGLENERSLEIMWDNGLMDAFRKGIAAKRKSIMHNMKEEIKQSKCCR